MKVRQKIMIINLTIMQILLKNSFTSRVVHFSVDLISEKAKQSFKDTDKMFLEYICLRSWERIIIFVVFGNNKFNLCIYRVFKNSFSITFIPMESDFPKSTEMSSQCL